MRKKYLVVILVLYSLNSFCQSKKPSSVSGQSEIDNLYQKYKNSKEIELYTSHGSITGQVTINYNHDKKPYSVNISSRSGTDADAVAEFLVKTIRMKKGQGYKEVKGSNQDFSGQLKPITEDDFWSYITCFKCENSQYFDIDMRKGSMYFRANAHVGYKQDTDIIKVFDDYRKRATLTYTLEEFKEELNRFSGWDKYLKPGYQDINWEIETGDVRRKGGSKTTNFEF